MALITETEHASVRAADQTWVVAAARERFSVIEPGARVGMASVIGAHVCIEAMAHIGAHCVIESGVHVCGGTTIEDRVHLGANVAFATAPRGANAAVDGPVPAPAIVREGAWIGANSSIAAGIVIGANARVRPARR